MAHEKQTKASAEQDRGILDTMLELGEATTLFTLDQMQTAANMLVSPSRALDHMKDSMATLSKAMKESTDERSKDPVARDHDGHRTHTTHVKRATVHSHGANTSGRKA